MYSSASHRDVNQKISELLHLSGLLLPCRWVHLRLDKKKQNACETSKTPIAYHLCGWSFVGASLPTKGALVHLCFKSETSVRTC